MTAQANPATPSYPAGATVAGDGVLLVDEDDVPIGAADKLDAHRRGLLHRAFSVFGFNTHGELLLQQRAHSKYHSGGQWSNTCCGHPRAGDDVSGAARRRLSEELGLTCGRLHPAGVVRYHKPVGALVENELDHVLVARVDGAPSPNPEEVAAWRYVDATELAEWLDRRPGDFTAWFATALSSVAAPAIAQPLARALRLRAFAFR